MKALTALTSIVLACGAFVAGWMCRPVADSSPHPPVGEPAISSFAYITPAKSPATELTNSIRQPIPAEIIQSPVKETQTFSTELTMEEALAALDRAILASPIYEDSDALFEEKYRGVSLEAATQAATLLDERIKREKERIIEERMQLGLYDERIKVGDEPITKVRGKGKGLSTFGFREAVMPDGSVRVRTTEVPAEEYPEFNSAQMEWWFLHRKLKGKGQLAKPQSIQQSSPSGG